MATKKSKILSSNDYIKIGVLCPDNSIMYCMNQKKTATFYHFMQRFSEETGIDLFEAKFFWNGKRVLSSDTPNSIGFKTGHILTCNIVYAYDIPKVDRRSG